MMNLSGDSVRNALISMMFVAVAIEAYVEFKAGNVPPRPARFVGVALVYGALALLVNLSSSLAAALGAGLLVALIVKIPSMKVGTTGGINAYGAASSTAPSAGGTATAGTATASTSNAQSLNPALLA